MIFTSGRVVRAAAGLGGLLLLGACATSHQEERIDAVKDFIGVAGLPELDSIRTRQKIDQDALNDKYVILHVDEEDYLLEYALRCVEDPLTNRPKPDFRYDARRLYARADTFRGCRIKALYAITPGQAEELRALGKAPGE